MTAATATAAKTNGKKVAPRAPRDHEVEKARDGLGNIGQVFPDAMDGTVPKSQQKAETSEEVKASVPRPSKDINKVITAAIEKISGLELQRETINSQIKAVVEDLESRGINRHAFRYAVRVMKMSESKREGYDLSYMLVRQAADQPLQQDWLDGDGESSEGEMLQ